MNTVAVVQARVGSTRLPGKVMYPLAGETVLSRVVERVRAASAVDEMVVATSSREQDAVVATEAERIGVRAYCGDECDVLGRIHRAANEADADAVVRVCGDDPLLPPECVDAVVERLRTADLDFASNNVERTFPVGFDVEAFTMESFSRVESLATAEADREHVTLYYKEHPDDFELGNVQVEAVYPGEASIRDPELRLTLDRAPDYELFRRVYDRFDGEGVIDTIEAVAYLREEGLDRVNAHVEQRSPESK